MTTTTAMVKSAPARALIVSEALAQEAEQRDLLRQYIRDHMIEGTDFGLVPNTTNKTLLKPGAEKLAQLFRCTPRFVIEEKIENWETGLFYYRFSCRIVTQADDTVVADGVGSCSTYESKYRWRSAKRKCPECGKETIIRGKEEYGGGWLCWKKEGKSDGCGAKFAADDSEITGQVIGRVPNPDILDQVNTVLKMAKKRALVDAAIALARVSDLFTQDLDDIVSEHAEQPQAKPQPATSTRPQPEPLTIERARAKLWEAVGKGAEEFARCWQGFDRLEDDNGVNIQAALAEDKKAGKARLGIGVVTPVTGQAQPAPVASGQPA